MKRFLLVVLLLVLVVGGVGWWLFGAVGPGKETFVEVDPGMTTPEIAATLEKQGVIRSRYAFDAMRLVKGGTLKAGEYRFDDAAPLATVYGRLVRGDVYTVALTVPEGYNIFDIAQAVEDAHLGTKQDFLAAARENLSMIADFDPHAPSMEGYLFPDTYHFRRRDTAAVMLGQMVKRFRQVAASLNLEGDVHNVVTLASLVEKETPVAEDRGLVAGVFTNRLNRGMTLDTDPSVIYAALLDGRYRGTIYASDLQAESAYNTYKHAGLPPGPICNPGVASLKAAMDPAKTDYLYFVSDPKNPGHSRFATTLEEHQRNVVAYRTAGK